MFRKILFSGAQALSIGALVAASQSVFATSFTASLAEQPGAWGTGITGQAFSPRENASPNVFDGFLLTDIFPTYLQEITFVRGGVAGGGDAETTVDIYQADAATFATATLIGSSANIVDTSGPDENSLYTFQFDNLELFHNTTYLAVFKDSIGNVIGLNVEQAFEGDAGVSDYTTGGALFDTANANWSIDTNADFRAVFNDTAPSDDRAYTTKSTTLFGEWSSGLQGQAFVPRTNAFPNAAFSGSQPIEVNLTSMSFTQGGNAGNGDSVTSLSIYRPTGATLATSELVGTSTNQLDTTNLAAANPADPAVQNGTTFNFEFDNLPLFYNTTYLAIFTDSSGNPVSVNIHQSWEGSPDVDVTISPGGGVFNYDSFGWAEETNADFTATFSVPFFAVPTLGFWGVLALLASLAGIFANLRRRV